ncbi:hypothetical protein [Halobacteriovorax sp. DA5]|uniref:hypothetical protein n=1 Tax=Halobacteriovorax sp. DA5 TaxID=2067553 RepID=UPI000CD10814|nr:hypothetical protein [Halobacteriovorax sp. DA5]POB14728.1 hypothetical protein C0Z22_06425 [Halobacteriovorax sp. DA5]
MLKVVVSCDAVIERDYYIECLETIMGVIGDNVELYTLVHRQGQVLGPVEQRKIHSTFLNRFVKSWEDLVDKSHLVHGAARGLFIPCSVDLVVNLSRGFSQEIKMCDDTYLFTYFVEDINSIKKKSSFKEFFFKAFTRTKQRKYLKRANTLWSNEEAILEEFPNATQVTPAIALKDYKILPEGMFNRDYFLINCEPLTSSEVYKIIDIYGDKKFKFIGKHDHLGMYAQKHPELFFGDRCSGELAPLLAGTKYLIDTTDKFPHFSLKALSCGRPVLTNGNKFLPYGVGVHELPADYLSLRYPVQVGIPDEDPKKRHGVSANYEMVKFKHIFLKEFKRISDEIEASKASQQSLRDDSCCEA